MTLKNTQSEDNAVFGLKSLYKQFGYKLYKMSRFEEYDLYAKNKSFLQTESIITFSDFSGRLLALKPDVTLSIVKNSVGGEDNVRLYYNESVYRVLPSNEIKETEQIGLEFIGDVDLYSQCEVIALAIKSLERISDGYILDVSHLGYIGALLEGCRCEETVRRELLECISQKNAHGIGKICRENNIGDDECARITEISLLYGDFPSVLERARSLACLDEMHKAVDELEDIYRLLKEMCDVSRVNIDFSIVNDMRYYDGVIFQGFAEGVPSYILSGGRYDRLVARMGKKGGAVGFAVNIDLISLYDSAQPEYDVDVLIVHNRCDYATLAAKVSELINASKSVRVEKFDSCQIRYKEKLEI